MLSREPAQTLKAEPPSQEPTTKWTVTDQLGSPRILVDSLGQIVSRREFIPFGEELYTGIGDRSASLNYGTSQDDIRQKFTGCQKDNETGLDFAEARMYANELGRFTALDPLLASGRSANPQTFNRYVYVSGNPLIRTDPTGLDWYGFGRNYRWSSDGKIFDDTEDEVTSDWSRVNFKATGRYYFEGCVDAECEKTDLYVLYRDSNTHGWSLKSFLGESVESFADANFQFQTYIASGAFIGFRNFARGVPNCLLECNFVGAPMDMPNGLPGGLSLSKLGIPNFFDYEGYRNTTQEVSGGVT